MRLLVLGGTEFLGRAVVDAALASGHDVTLFNRGRTNPDLFPDVERLVGDRDGDLFAFAGRSWDAVVDPSGYVPRVVRASAELLRGSVEHYVFVSSISVYDRTVLAPWSDESAQRVVLREPSEDVPSFYGELKAACEDVVRDVFPDAFTNVRAGLIVGPHDPTGRFTYWPTRIARRGEVVAPGDPKRAIQFVDARDLGAWLVHAAESRVVGDVNATGPEQRLSMGELLEACRAVSGSDAELVWMDDAFLLAHGARPWMELPLWVVPEEAAFLQVDVSRAVAAGLRFRPLAETVADALAWSAGAPTTRTLSSGMVLGEPGMRPEKERELLAAWRSR